MDSDCAPRWKGKHGENDVALNALQIVNILVEEKGNQIK